jgi:DHA1 family bicyclomycin/chloramphenicol resistance-like MFS transporter
LVLGLLAALPALSIDIGLPAFPEMALGLGVAPNQVQLTVSVFLLGLAASQPVIGPLSDRYGRRPLILGGLLLHVLAGIGCVVSGGIAGLVVCRFVQGFGAAAGIVLSRAVVRDLCDGRDSGRMLSGMMLITGGAPLVAPLLGSAIVIATDSWRAVFVFLVLTGAAIATVTIWQLPESLPAAHRVPVSIPLIVRRTYRFFSFDACRRNALIVAFLYGGLLSYMSGSAFVLMVHDGVPEAGYGVLLAFTALVLMAGAMANRRLLRHRSPERLLDLGLGLLFLASALLLTGYAVGPHDPAWLVGPMMVYVLSFGLIAPNATTAAMATVPDMAGTASSLMFSLQALFGALAGYLVNLLQTGSSLSTVSFVVACGAGAVLMHFAPGRPR